MKQVALICIMILTLDTQVLIGQNQTEERWLAKKYEMLNLPYSKEKDSLTFEESLAKWELLKKENGNSYIYQQRFDSWTGYTYKTQIVVENGKVTSRIYDSWMDDGEIEKKLFSYVEKEKEVGSHYKGAPAITIDSLYATAFYSIQVDKTNNTVIFTTFENGLLHTCGHIPNGCEDDCFIGKEIYAMVWLNEKEKK